MAIYNRGAIASERFYDLFPNILHTTNLSCMFSVYAQGEICSSFPLWDDQEWKTGSDLIADDEFHRCIFWADYAYNTDVGDLHGEYTDFLVDATKEKKIALDELTWKVDVVYTLAELANFPIIQDLVELLGLGGEAAVNAVYLVAVTQKLNDLKSQVPQHQADYLLRVIDCTSEYLERLTSGDEPSGDPGTGDGESDC